MPELVADNLTKTYPSGSETLHVLCGVSLALSAGENLAVLGPSGAGKSTLLHILGGLDSPTSGSVRLRDIDPFQLHAAELADFRNRHIGFIFQDHYLLPQLTALENVLVPVLAQRRITAEHAGRAEFLLGGVGLRQRQHHRPGQLSGGERQRVAVARALIMQPVLLLADEPTGSLDAKSAQTIGEILCDLPRREGAILICVTHSEALARVFQRRAVLEEGALVPERTEPR
jgi:lipoprotein-releasing system ATP-binding protein